MLDAKGDTVRIVGQKRVTVFTGGLLSVVLLVGLAACGSSSSGANVLGKSTADLVVKRVDSVPRFDPDKLEIPLNQDVSFSVLNKDKVLHNVTIPAFAVDMDVQPGQRIEVKIPAVSQVSRDGFWVFYDKYYQSQGTAGRITVSK